MEQLEEAQNNDVYDCGMQAFDVDHPIHGVIIAREGLECHHPMKFIEYYNTTIKIRESAFNASLYAYCAGSSGAKGIVDETLRVKWKSVLPLCTSRTAASAIPLTRTRRRDGATNGQRAKPNQPLRLKPLLRLLFLLLLLMLFLLLRSHLGSRMRRQPQPYYTRPPRSSPNTLEIPVDYIFLARFT